MLLASTGVEHPAVPSSRTSHRSPARLLGPFDVTIGACNRIGGNGGSSNDSRHRGAGLVVYKMLQPRGTLAGHNGQIADTVPHFACVVPHFALVCLC
jgi:hypothetical protein